MNMKIILKIITIVNNVQIMKLKKKLIFDVENIFVKEKKKTKVLTVYFWLWS